MWQARKRYQERLRYFRRNVSGGWGAERAAHCRGEALGAPERVAKPPVFVGWLERREKLLHPPAGLGGKKKCPVRLRARLVGSGEDEERKTSPICSKASRGFEIPIRGERRVWGRCLLPVGM